MTSRNLKITGADGPPEHRPPFVHFVVPVYNCEASLLPNVLAISRHLESCLAGEYEIVLSNDGSVDRTWDVARKLEESDPRIRTVGYERNQGRGYAVMHAASTCSGELLIYADLDLPRTTDLECIPKILDGLKESSVVIGSRFHRDSRTQRIRLRNMIGITHRSLVRFFFPWLQIRDPDAGFKGFRLPTLRRIISRSRLHRWSWDLEAMVIARSNGFAVAEIPINWNERHEAYATSVKLWRDMWEEFAGMLTIRRNFRRGLYRL